MSVVKNLMAGRILDDRLFPYPAMRSKDREVLGMMVDAIDQFLGPKQADFKRWDREAMQPAEFIQGLRDLGLFGLIINAQSLRKILAFNVLGGGVFLLFGVVARRGAAAGLGSDPVPQALVITGIVVAFSATALAVALLLRLFEETGQTSLTSDDPADGGDTS